MGCVDRMTDYSQHGRMVGLTKTTLYLRQDLHRRLKAYAARARRSMTELVEAGVDETLRRAEADGRNDAAQRLKALERWRRLARGFGRGARAGVRDHNEIYED